jgi:hypothetical protein
MSSQPVTTSPPQQRYRPPTKLPIGQLAIHLRPCPGTDADVAGLSRDYLSATKKQQVDLFAVDLPDLLEERDVRRQATLRTLQQLYAMAEAAIPLCEQQSTAWRDLRGKLQTRRAEQLGKAKKSIAKLFAHLTEGQVEAKSSQVSDVTALDQEINEAYSASHDWGREGVRLRELAQAVRQELQSYVDFLRD